MAISGTGNVVSNPAGINCTNPAGTGSVCSASYPAGTSVTLTATVTNTKRDMFTGWSGGGCAGSTPTCAVALNSNQSVQAIFQKGRQAKAQKLPRRTAQRSMRLFADGNGSPLGGATPEADLEGRPSLCLTTGSAVAHG